SAFLKPWYALLLSVFFVLHGFTENFYLIPARDTLFFLLACLGISLMLIALFWLFFKNIQKAAFLTFLLLAFNYFFGYIHDGLKLFFPSSFVTKYSVLLSAAFLVFVLILILLKRRKEFSKRLTIYLNLLFLISIITDTGILIKKSLSFSYDEKRNLSGEKVLSCTEKNLPDVYLIVADEYAGSKDLADICGFDNTPFLDSLRQRGFFVANNSHSNYNYTTYSMASVLNMDYLPLKQEQVKKADHGYALKLIFNNKVTSFFKNAGYEIRNYSSFDISGQPAQNNNSFIPARTTLFASQTLINRLKKDIWLNVARILNLRSVLLKALYENQQYNQQIYQHAVSNIHDADTLPEFVYIHLQLPHYPYYYDKDGNLYPLETISNDVPGNTKNYVQYVQYTNRVLLKMTDEILTHKGPPPVIILMSDHGYRCFPEGFDPYIFMNLFSVYLPHKDYSLFSDSLTNVNVFRKVLNSEFCQQFPMLKDSSITVHN
ncbi:MAG: hypothetical protein EPN92_11150, partial [Chitinophagaceae bacterium]